MPENGIKRMRATFKSDKLPKGSINKQGYNRFIIIVIATNEVKLSSVETF